MTEQALQDVKRFTALKGIARPKTNLEIAEEVERCRYMSDEKFDTYVGVAKSIYARERSKIVEKYKMEAGEVVERNPTEAGIVTLHTPDGRPLDEKRRKELAQRAAQLTQQKRAAGQYADFETELAELVRSTGTVPVVPRDESGNVGQATQARVDGESFGRQSYQRRPMERYHATSTATRIVSGRPVQVQKYSMAHFSPTVEIVDW